MLLSKAITYLYSNRRVTPFEIPTWFIGIVSYQARYPNCPRHPVRDEYQDVRLHVDRVNTMTLVRKCTP